MNELVRPSMYDSYHEITVLTNNTKVELANFCGNVCESGDILGIDGEPKLIRKRDTIDDMMSNIIWL